MGLSMFGTNSKSFKKLLSQTASLTAYKAAIYSASMAEFAILDCLILLQTTAALSRVNTEPNIHFLEFLSPWKSESVYPSIFRSSPEYTNI